MHDHTLENTAAWATKVQQAGMMGLINTSWASFHTPLLTQIPYVAATGAMMQGTAADLDDSWFAEFLSKYYGADSTELPQALRELGANWEHEVGSERPITPIVYGYMDMMLHYPKGVDDRKRRGSYPLDWQEVDFVDLYRKKIDLLRGAADQSAVLSKLSELQSLYEHAIFILNTWNEHATLHMQEAKVLASLANTKYLHTRVLRFLIDEDVQSERRSKEDGLAQLLTQLEAQNELLMEHLSPFFEELSIRRLWRLWCEPAATVLRDTGAFYLIP
jgi:hypothetical protein